MPSPRRVLTTGLTTSASGVRYEHDRDFGWYFANGYDRTIKILPEIDDRPIPDAQHLVLQALSLIVAMAATVAMLRREA